MMQAEKVATDLRDAQDAIAGENSAAVGLAGVMRRLDRRRAQAPALIDPVVKAIDASLVALDGAQAALETALRETAFEPGELERVEERLFALRGLARRHGTSVDQLPTSMQEFASDLEMLEAGEARLLELKSAVESATRGLSQFLRRMSKARASPAERLDKAVAKELPPLRNCKARNSRPISRGIPTRFSRWLRSSRISCADKSRLASGSADEGCLRAGAPTRTLHACAQSCRRRSRLRAHAGLQQD